MPAVDGHFSEQIDVAGRVLFVLEGVEKIKVERAVRIGGREGARSREGGRSARGGGGLLRRFVRRIVDHLKKERGMEIKDIYIYIYTYVGVGVCVCIHTYIYVCICGEADVSWEASLGVIDHLKERGGGS